LGELQACQPHLSPWEGDGVSPAAVISRHLKEKEEIAKPIQVGEIRRCLLPGC